MPGEMGRVGIERRFVGQPKLFPVIAGQGLLVGTLLREMVAGDDDREVVSDRPEPVIKQPVGVLAKCDAISDVVVPGIRELVDMGGVDEAARGDRQYTVAGQRTSIIIGGDDLEPEPGFPTLLTRLFRRLMFGRADNLVFVGDRNAENGAKA